MVELSLIKLSGKPLTKLIKVVSSGLGVLYEPRKIRRKAKAKADALLILTDARRKALVNLDSDIVEELVTIEKASLARKFLEKDNIDSVVEQTAIELNGESVNDEPVDKDWTILFFDEVKKISNEGLRLIWAKILAGEIRKPGTFSKRLINLLKTMSQQEATKFQALVDHSFNCEGTFFLIANQYGGFTRKYSVEDDVLASTHLLRSIGLIYPYTGYDQNSRAIRKIDYLIEGVKIEEPLRLFCGNACMQIEFTTTVNPLNQKVNIPGYHFTPLGNELALIVSNNDSKAKTSRMSKIKSIAESVVQAHHNLGIIHKIKYGIIKQGGKNNKKFRWKDAKFVEHKI